ncbi:endonuclease/exonuclease/phosphatase family protein [Polynucleobacter sphagniphilus]|uniref:endonuclease/exonuclease/phosphatase family protein n=1 Tax=Polynucleobacter sphagniphilus TaxID=1743169 RepID=UPI002475C9D4|nr:endonuclease/exonuclease/phosphatase family protein [Polynucleobacter sphagniphilus]MDH6524019.1 endonuclease/exonuclease/phosphatase family metal-dependent hydrolase [Polynucleobacter sphagniphilus]
MHKNKPGQFSVMTMNVHKGLSPLHRRTTIYELRQKMRHHHPDLLFLQELQQEHRGRIRRYGQWPLTEMTHFLSENFWQDWHYGKNAEYADGHHGNAILSKQPLFKGQNYDISAYRFEKRGLLHSVMQLEGLSASVHCFCVHLALFERGRERQLEEIIHYIDTLAADRPVIVAGDFNDWRNRMSVPMQQAGFVEVFEILTGAPAKTFPSVKPILPMDRIYVRGLRVRSASILHEWLKLSDHLGITAQLELI